MRSKHDNRLPPSAKCYQGNFVRNLEPNKKQKKQKTIINQTTRRERRNVTIALTRVLPYKWRMKTESGEINSSPTRTRKRVNEPTGGRRGISRGMGDMAVTARNARNVARHGEREAKAYTRSCRSRPVGRRSSLSLLSQPDRESSVLSVHFDLRVGERTRR